MYLTLRNEETFIIESERGNLLKIYAFMGKFRVERLQNE